MCQLFSGRVRLTLAVSLRTDISVDKKYFVMTKKLLTIITIFFFSFAFGQTPNIVGTWKMIKHTTTFNGDKNYDYMKHTNI